MRPQDDLNKMSVKDLRAIAAAIGIDASSMKKPQVIEAVLSAGTPAGENIGGSKEKEEPEKRAGRKSLSKEKASEDAAAPAKRGRGRPPKAKKTEIGKAEPVFPETPGEALKVAPAEASKVTSADSQKETPAGPQKEAAASSNETGTGYDTQKIRTKNFTPEQRAAQFRRDVQSDIERSRNYSFSFTAQNQDKNRQNGQRTPNQRYFEPRNSYDRAPARDFSAQEKADPEGNREAPKAEEEKEFDCYGILEINQNGYGFLRAETLYPGTKDIFVPPPLIRRHLLRTGDMITGKARAQSKEYNAQFALSSVIEINGIIAENLTQRPSFDTLTPTYPDERLVLETTRNEYATRIIDLFSPIGKGQRGLIVSPPKAGKTVLLKTIANALIRNYPDVHLIMLLIDERPEEVTDIKESVKAMVVASTFDEMTSRHIAVSEFCLEHAERMVEMGEDVVILMDSITRLARAYNQEVTPSGRSLSGGLDPAALYKPKKFFGAARNIKGGGSLTIIATALVDTGSRLDDVIYEEFKGTGNMELHLDRSLAERRIFPSIDITLSGTRKEELLLPSSALDKIYALRRSFANVNNAKDITEAVINNIAKTEDNKQFLNSIKYPGMY